MCWVYVESCLCCFFYVWCVVVCDLLSSTASMCWICVELYVWKYWFWCVCWCVYHFTSCVDLCSVLGMWSCFVCDLLICVLFVIVLIVCWIIILQCVVLLMCIVVFCWLCVGFMLSCVCIVVVCCFVWKMLIWVEFQHVVFMLGFMNVFYVCLGILWICVGLILSFVCTFWCMPSCCLWCVDLCCVVQCVGFALCCYCVCKCLFVLMIVC